MATARFQKQVTFTEEEWKLLHSASVKEKTSAHAFLKDAVMAAAKKTLGEDTDTDKESFV